MQLITVEADVALLAEQAGPTSLSPLRDPPGEVHALQLLCLFCGDIQGPVSLINGGVVHLGEIDTKDSQFHQISDFIA